MLNLKWSGQVPAPVAGQFLAVPHSTEQDPETLAERFGVAIRDAVGRAPFSGEAGETFRFTQERSGILINVALIGVGAGVDTAESIRKLAHDAVRGAATVGADTAVLDLRGQSILGGTSALTPALIGTLVAEGCMLGTYQFDQFRSEAQRKPQSVRQVHVCADSDAAADATERGLIYGESIARARDLANGPPVQVTPSYLASTAKEIVDSLKRDRDVSLKVLERDACEKLGMGCFLGVARGSEEPPKFIHLTYRPKGQSKGRVCLVGKGVTFDSGGYSLKPTDGMLDMKLDMAGAAAVIGAFEGAARLSCPYEVHAIVAATENLVSGAAYKLGDVLVASNGKTVEVNNTDAEGRLTLADALVYAGKLEPTVVLDFATLTGACLVALGPKIAGVMTNDDALYDDWMSAAARSAERMWRLPLPVDLKEQLKSKVADMKNTGERWGGALTAGLFLSEFTEGLRWLHVDIAGPAMASKAHGVTTPGGSGFAVATILELLRGDLSPAR